MNVSAVEDVLPEQGGEPRTVELRLRAMTPADVPQVHAIDVLSFDLPWPERAFRYEVEHNRNALCWVAEARDSLQPEAGWQLAAATVIWLVVDEAHIGTIAVLPEFRGLKIGKKLLARVLLESIKGGALSAQLEVRRGNLVARAMYARFGFEEVGLRRRYYRDNGEDAILMTLANLDAESLQHRLEP
jgi:ribosomal-protein-alanine N-acetyltransferase